ncbi:MAG: hypothetical protein Q6365_005360 [Candidatus Sigynarchaeota archaeon]
MSETTNADLFKSRLAQLKKVLERDGKIAENLFYAALQLDKNKEFKSSVQEILDKHKMKVKKGYLCLPDDEKDRSTAVKALLKDSFEFLLKAFNVDKSQLVQRPRSEQKLHALQLFEMQSTLEAQAASQAGAFESTMQDLDKIDTSTPLEQIINVAPNSEVEAPAKSEPRPVQAPMPPVPPAQPTVISKLAMAEQKPDASPTSGVKPLPVSSTIPPVVRKPTPLPPRYQQKGTIQATPVVHSSAQDVVTPTEPAQTPTGAQALVPTRKPISPAPDAIKPAPEPPAASMPNPAPEATAAPALGPFPPPSKATVPAPSPLVPEPASAPIPAPPITYEYYVCNRCGVETSRSAIRQVGAFIECPNCKFTFSRAEATIIQKAPPGSDKATGTRQDESKSSFDLFGSKQPSEDESLIRPSWLFADKEKEGAPPARTAPTVKAPEGGSTKPRPEPSERLVRPSQYLGLSENSSPSNQPEPAPSPADSKPAPTEAEKIAEAPASEYFVEEQPDLQRMKKVPRGPIEKAPVLTPRPSETPAQETPGDLCPRCGASKYSKIQDRNKVISYNPLMYGYKKKCTMCSFEFD